MHKLTNIVRFEFVQTRESFLSVFKSLIQVALEHKNTQILLTSLGDNHHRTGTWNWVHLLAWDLSLQQPVLRMTTCQESELPSRGARHATSNGGAYRVHVHLATDPIPSLVAR